MDSMPVISLSDDQKQKLLELAQNAPELVTHRARLILAYAAGKPTLQAASDAGISRGRARFWKRQFFARGMDIFTLDLSTAADSVQVARSAARLKKDSPSEVMPATSQPDDSTIKELIPFPEPRQSIGILPEDSLAEAGRRVWLFHFALMLCHEQGTLLGQDVEQLHDMRVATRRMRTAFDVFGPAFDARIMKHYLKSLRRIGRVLGRVRDMDVILDHALTYQRKLHEDKQAEFEPLMSAWKQVIGKKRAKLTRLLQSDGYQAFKLEFNAFLQSPGQIQAGHEEHVMNVHLRDIVPVLVYARYAAVKAYDSIIPFASEAQLHALRIDFKRFRYVLEYFREVLGENAGQCISEIKQYQDHLGLLHDTVVACQLVSDFLAGWEKEQLTRPIHLRHNPETIVAYLAYLQDARYHLINSFPEMWQKFSRPQFRQGLAQAISHL